MKTHLPRLAILLSVCSLGIVPAARAAVLDFEQMLGSTPVEGTVVSNQFRGHYGVRFLPLVTTNGTNTPIIVRRGWPQAAYGTTTESDEVNPTDPLASQIGEFFMSVRSEKDPRGFVCVFDAPVSTVQFHALDIDNRESILLKAYASETDTNALITRTFATGGEARVTVISIAATNPSQNFVRLELSVTSTLAGHNSLLGYDNFTLSYVPPAAPVPLIGLALYPGLAIEGVVGRRYRVDYADSLDVSPTGTNWHTLTNIFLPASPYLHLDTKAANSKSRFYRVVGIQ